MTAGLSETPWTAGKTGPSADMVGGPFCCCCTGKGRGRTGRVFLCCVCYACVGCTGPLRLEFEGLGFVRVGCCGRGQGWTRAGHHPSTAPTRVLHPVTLFPTCLIIAAPACSPRTSLALLGSIEAAVHASQ